MRPIIDPVALALLRPELEARPPLERWRNFEIYGVRGDECPSVMLEIGRSREQAFREVGAGRGAEVDLDELDFGPRRHGQVVVWDPVHAELVAAVRYMDGEGAARAGQRVDLRVLRSRGSGAPGRASRGALRTTRAHAGRAPDPAFRAVAGARFGCVGGRPRAGIPDSILARGGGAHGERLPPILISYSGLSADVWCGETAVDADFADALEVGIIVPLDHVDAAARARFGLDVGCTPRNATDA